MNWIIMGLIALLALFFLKNLKHHFVRKSMTIFFVMAIILMALLFTSSYLDIGGIFSRESIFAKTGAAVVDTVGDNVDSSSLSEFFSGISSSVSNLTGSAFSSPESGTSDFLKLND